MIRFQFISLLIFCASVLPAQYGSKVRFVRAAGEAVVSVKPDRAQVTVGVSVSAATAAIASSQNAEDTERVLTAVRRTLGTGGEVKTSGYSISPKYEYPQGRAARLTGYEAANSVIITVNELPLLGKVIDAATGSGANNINGVEFMLRDDSGVRADALAKAASQARINAEAMARALNVRVMGLLEAEPTEIPQIRPLARTMAPMQAMAAKTSTPIEAGDLEIRASVTVTLEVQ